MDDVEDVEEEMESEGEAGKFTSGSSLPSEDDPEGVADAPGERGRIMGAVTTLDPAAVLRQTVHADVHEVAEQDEVQEP